MKRVLTCVHDVTPCHFAHLRTIDSFLRELGLEGCYSMLVVPDYWGLWPLEDHPDFVDWLRERAVGGVEVVLHGFYHRDEVSHRSTAARWKATVLTDRESEFLGLEYEEARRRLVEGRRLLESLLGQEVEGFVAPAWLYSTGTQRALRDLSFGYSETHRKLWSPARPDVGSFAPVINYATRDRKRVAASLAASRLATVLLRPLPLIRFAIHPSDLDVERIDREARRALADLLKRRRPVRYREIVTEWAEASPMSG